jgi:ArsR family transcriptional regulator
MRTRTIVERAKMAKAIAEPARLKLLDVLASSPGNRLCVNEMSRKIRRTQPATSRHLATLREAGLVTVERDGKYAFYSIAETGFANDLVHLFVGNGDS